MENILASIPLPADLDILSMVKFIGIFAFASLFLGLLGRVALGKRSDLNHAVSSVMAIVFIYIVTIIVYTFNPADLARFLSPLPFAHFREDVLAVGLMGGSFSAICKEVLSMVILAFLVNLLDTLIPKGKKVVGWYLWRLVSVLLAMALHYVVTWAFNTFLPDLLVTYAPMILLAVLLLLLFLGVLKVLVGLVLAAVNPILAALYTFFFASAIGKQLSKAVLTTILLCAMVYALDYFGYAAIAISASTLGNYVPLLAALLVLWYLIGHVL